MARHRRGVRTGRGVRGRRRPDLADQVIVAVTAMGSIAVTRYGGRRRAPGTWRRSPDARAGPERPGVRSPQAVDAYRRPEPPYAAGAQAAALGATAMISVSDGLLADLGHVARASSIDVTTARFEEIAESRCRRWCLARLDAPVILSVATTTAWWPPSLAALARGLAAHRHGVRGRGRHGRRRGVRRADGARAAARPALAPSSGGAASDLRWRAPAGSSPALAPRAVQTCARADSAGSRPALAPARRFSAGRVACRAELE